MFCLPKYLSLAICLACALIASATNPMATDFGYDDCLGTHIPYTSPLPDQLSALPDSLTPVFVNHVGRHGARFPTSPKSLEQLRTALSRSPLSEKGKRLETLLEEYADCCSGHWGELDSLGASEQRGIASRMTARLPRLFGKGRHIEARSSYVPRCVMSMFEFLHEINRLDPSTDFSTVAGPQTNPMLRFFQVDTAFVMWRAKGTWKAPYQMMFDTSVPSAPARRLFADPDALSSEEAQSLSQTLYSVLSGLPAMGMPDALPDYFTRSQANDCWALSNLSHYLQRCQTTISSLPADISGPLLAELIETLDDAAMDAAAYTGPTAILRFGHAETLMPLLSLMRLPGCYYLTNYFDTVGLHWQDFHVVPMAANLQMILLRGTEGNLYLQILLNERPVVLPGTEPYSPGGFMPWQRARNFLLGCLPL